MDVFDDSLFGSFAADGASGRSAEPRQNRDGKALESKRAFPGVDVAAADAKRKRPAATSLSLAVSVAAAEEAPSNLDPGSGRKACKHEVAMPPGVLPTEEMLRLPRSNKKPAREYPFELDPFQQAAISCIEREESVLVSAHTSAGKTVCAEYAIAVSLRDKQRVIYTSPIKALSNQKFRELQEEFGDVGLMTGDYTINVDATCLVMTTEILRSMLYRGSEVTREVKWVVFDEVHYMRDKERGVVWEEVMILLNHSVRYVFLSATIPNALQFAEWIAHLHSQPCHVVYTDYRPTPLHHYMFGAGSTGFHLVVDENGQFKPTGFERATASTAKAAAAKSARGGGGRGGGGRGGRGGRGKSGPSDCFKLVRTVVSMGMEPLIVFAFGKKLVEDLAEEMGSLDLTSETERQSITAIYENAISTLSEDDQELPSIERMLPLLQRGVAVHHSGLLPLLKELVEILFQENLVKLLFATETFAMGLNMPAKTVIFADLSKFDGSQFRYLSSGEYIQMSGRAGRRGLDARGTVITMVDHKTEHAKVREMLCGAADRLTSRFHLSYNMLLNCVRMEEADIDFLIKNSFHTFQLQQARPELERRQRELVALLSSAELAVPNESLVVELRALLLQERAVRAQLQPHLNRPKAAEQFLQPGRLARFGAPSTEGRGLRPIKAGQEGDGLPAEWGWGVLVSYRRLETKAAKGAKSDDPFGEASEYEVDVMLACEPDAAEMVEAGGLPEPARDLESAELHVLPLSLADVQTLSTVRVSLPKDLRTPDSRHSVLKVLREVKRRFPEGVPQLHPFDDLAIEEHKEEISKHLRKLESVQARLANKELSQAQVRKGLSVLRQRTAAEEEEKLVRRQIKEGQVALMTEELRGMRRVLRRLGHLSEDGVIGNKGRVACEVSTSDELLITELVFAGIFQELEPAQLAALLSCLVAEHGFSGGKTKDGKKEDPLALIREHTMRHPVEALRDMAKRIATVVLEAKLPVDVDEYIARFATGLVDIVYDWCRGAKFADICRLTDAYEGSIIRALHRLEELLRQLIDAARVVGNEQLQSKCEQAQKLLVRDVVFCPSLYT